MSWPVVKSTLNEGELLYEVAAATHERVIFLFSSTESKFYFSIKTHLKIITRIFHK